MLACPICSSPAAIVRGRDFLPWHYWRCRRCRHAFLHPAPSPAVLSRYYNTAYQVPRRAYESSVPAVYSLVAPMLPGPPGALLEIGCSYGALLARFRDAGWDVEGVEIDERAATHARAQYGLAVHGGTLERAAGALRHAPFDAIMLHHVIEHVRDPWSFVRSISSLLRPGGHVIIRTPNSSAAAMKFEGGWWEWSAAPEHLHLYSSQSLTRLLSVAGLKPQLANTRRGDARGVLFEGLSYLVRRARARAAAEDAGEKRSVELRQPQTSMNTSWFPILRRSLEVVGAPLDRLLGRMGMGPELLVLAVSSKDS